MSVACGGAVRTDGAMTIARCTSNTLFMPSTISESRRLSDAQVPPHKNERGNELQKNPGLLDNQKYINSYTSFNLRSPSTPSRVHTGTV